METVITSKLGSPIPVKLDDEMLQIGEFQIDVANFHNLLLAFNMSEISECLDIVSLEISKMMSLLVNNNVKFVAPFHADIEMISELSKLIKLIEVK